VRTLDLRRVNRAADESTDGRAELRVSEVGANYKADRRADLLT
jgi:hypothetical protein